jgi:hypothetical protein
MPYDARGTHENPASPPPEPTSLPEPVLPPLGEVPVTDLFTILVDQHGFPVADAVRAVATGLLRAGYPMDHDRVSPADAFDILDWALGSGH